MVLLKSLARFLFAGWRPFVAMQATTNIPIHATVFWMIHSEDQGLGCTKLSPTIIVRSLLLKNMRTYAVDVEGCRKQWQCSLLYRFTLSYERRTRESTFPAHVHTQQDTRNSGSGK